MNYLKQFNLKGKKAFIVGGSGLLGIQISNAISQAGAKTLNVISTSGIGLATNLSITWISVGLAAILASVWDGDSGGTFSSTSTTN